MNTFAKMLILALTLLGAALYYIVKQVVLYFQEPHNDGDPILYVEHGRMARHDRWLGWHYDTLIITRTEFILNDVLTFYDGYQRALPYCHSIKKSQIVHVESGTCIRRFGFRRTNLKIAYLTSKGETEHFYVHAKNPQLVMRYLDSANTWRDKTYKV